MSVTVKLYGRFREFAPNLDTTSGTIGIVQLEGVAGEIVEDLLNILELDSENVGHVFVNGNYASLKKAVNGGDRVAIFPDDMGLLYHWYFEKED